MAVDRAVGVDHGAHEALEDRVRQRRDLDAQRLVRAEHGVDDLPLVTRQKSGAVLARLQLLLGLRDLLLDVGQEQVLVQRVDLANARLDAAHRALGRQLGG